LTNQSGCCPANPLVRCTSPASYSRRRPVLTPEASDGQLGLSSLLPQGCRIASPPRSNSSSAPHPFPPPHPRIYRLEARSASRKVENAGHAVTEPAAPLQSKITSPPTVGRSCPSTTYPRVPA
jgi:hypothetical protein